MSASACSRQLRNPGRIASEKPTSKEHSERFLDYLVPTVEHQQYFAGPASVRARDLCVLEGVQKPVPFLFAQDIGAAVIRWVAHHRSDPRS
jgi:hypothetical protein